MRWLCLLLLLSAGCARDACWPDDGHLTCSHHLSDVERVQETVAMDFHCYRGIEVSRGQDGIYAVAGCGRTARYDCGWAHSQNIHRPQMKWVCDELTPAKTLPALRTQQVAVGATPALLVDADDARTSLVITNPGSDPLYVAATPNVTTATGQAVLPGASLTIKDYKGALFAVAPQAAVATYSEETRIAGR